MGFIGNQPAWDFFEYLVPSGRLSHAYILSGPAQVGKETLARSVAARLFTVEYQKLPTHPDFFFLTRLTDEKTGKRKKEITIEQARDLKLRARGSSWSGGWRAVIIDDADSLGEEASNALLKLLEEPSPKTVFFLLTVHPENLLPTIRSRAETLALSPVPESDIAAALRARHVPESLVGEYVRASWGRPGRALSFVVDPAAWERYQAELSRLKNLRGQPFYRQAALVEEWFGKGEDSRVDRDDLDATLELWIMAWREEMLSSVALSPAQASVVVRIIQKISDARRLIRQNVNPRLVIEDLVLGF